MSVYRSSQEHMSEGNWPLANPHPKTVISNHILATVMEHLVGLSPHWSVHKPPIKALRVPGGLFVSSLSRTKNTKAKFLFVNFVHFFLLCLSEQMAKYWFAALACVFTGCWQLPHHCKEFSIMQWLHLFNWKSIMFDKHKFSSLKS